MKFNYNKITIIYFTDTRFRDIFRNSCQKKKKLKI